VRNKSTTSNTKRVNELPNTIESLIKWLDEQIPPRCPGKHWDDREIWWYAGQRALVDMLINKYKLEVK
jgi:hypothetical protein